MQNRTDEARRKLRKIPKVRLGFFPTPMHRLERLSHEMGVDIYLKRDDLTGMNLFGGNKMRKLEYLMAEAVEEGADTVITYGASQSNHAMQTASSARKLGILPILFLVDLIEQGEHEPKGNMLINQIMDAEVHITEGKAIGFAEGLVKARENAEIRMREMERLGHKCYEIPMGGSNATGAMGFIEAFVEMTEELEKEGKSADYLYHATGSGGTLAGLSAGKVLLESETKIVGISVGIDHEGYKQEVTELANEALVILGHEEKVSHQDFEFVTSYYGEGYEIISEGAEEAIRLLAEREGVLLDPVYTAKAFAGMIDHIQKGTIKKGSTVVFWHTGGVSALFAEKELLGNLLGKK